MERLKGLTAIVTGGGSEFGKGLPLGRFITPEDVGQAAVFLSSSVEAGAFTGCELPVDAGRCI